MPISEPDKNRDYQREWAKKLRATETPEDKERRLRLRRASRKRRLKSGNLREVEYQKGYRARPGIALKSANQKLRKEYGPMWEAKRALIEFNKIQRTDPVFESVPWIKAEKKRKPRKRGSDAKNKDRTGKNYQDRVRDTIHYSTWGGRDQRRPLGNTSKSKERKDLRPTGKRDLASVERNPRNLPSGNSNRKYVRRRKADGSKKVLRPHS